MLDLVINVACTLYRRIIMYVVLSGPGRNVSECETCSEKERPADAIYHIGPGVHVTFVCVFGPH
jgi:hypothetical protein